ncbi:MAG: type I-E CRISPR-associated protein Cas6/Cse3/CasE [Dehalococcoidia bacterium]
MYLSRLLLNPRNRDTMRWLADCHQLHRVIMAGFPHVEAETARQDLGVLFRVETPAPDGSVAVLVQSRAEPHWRLESRAAHTDPAVSLDGLLAGIAAGRRYRFRLRANPTRRVHHRATLGPDPRELDIHGNWKAPGEIPENERTGLVRRAHIEPPRAWHIRDDGKRIGKRVELRREEERLLWLQRQGARCGFEIVTASLAPALGETGPRPFAAARADPAPRLWGYQDHRLDRKLTFATALFEGELRVTEPVAFRAAIEEGIGPGKAFGCGLLSIASIQQM